MSALHRTLFVAIALCSACHVYVERRTEPPPLAPLPPLPPEPVSRPEPPLPPDAPGVLTRPEPPSPPDALGVRVEADAYDDQDPTALQDFHGALDGHGVWVDDPSYGTVWVPNGAEVGPDFVPYVNAGHWAYGDDYVWVSDYGWGWAPFHYGRWLYMDGRGWGWIPGREYAPAWVIWRTGDAYVGWAPAPPGYIWRGGVAVRTGFVPPEPRYVFCGHGDLFSPAPGRAIIVGPRAREIEGRTRVYGDPGGQGHIGRGPAPASLGIAPTRVVRPSGHEVGLARAEGFARPSTAQPMGAHPPTRPVAAATNRGQPPFRAEPPVRAEPHFEPPGMQTRTAAGHEGTPRQPDPVPHPPGKEGGRGEGVHQPPPGQPSGGRTPPPQPVRAAEIPTAPRPIAPVIVVQHAAPPSGATPPQKRKAQ